MLWFAKGPTPERVGDRERYRLAAVGSGQLWAITSEPLPDFLRRAHHEMAFFASDSRSTVATLLEACAPHLESAFVQDVMRDYPVDPRLREAECRLATTDTSEVLVISWLLAAHRAFAGLFDGAWVVGIQPLPGEPIRLANVMSGEGFAHTPRPLAD